MVSIRTRFTNTVYTSANYVQSRIIMRNKVTRAVSVLMAAGVAGITGHQIYNSPKAAKLWSEISIYAQTTAFPYMRERVIPYFYMNHRFTRLSVGVVAGVATLVALAVYTRLRAIRRELVQALAHNVQLRDQVQAESAVIATLRGQIAAQPAALTALQEQINAHPAQLEALRVQMNGESEAVHAELQQQINVEQAHTAQIQQRLDNQIAEQAKVQQDLDTARQALAALGQTHGQDLARHDEIRQQLEEQKVALSTQVKEYAITCADLQQQLEASQQQLAQLKNTHAQECQKLLQQINEQQAELTNLEKSRDDVLGELELTNHEHGISQASQLQQLTAVGGELEAAKKQITDLQHRVDDLIQSRGFAETGLIKAQAEIEKLQQENQTLKASPGYMNTVRLKALEDENNTLKGLQDSQAKIVPKLQRQIDKLSQEKLQLIQDNQLARQEQHAANTSARTNVPSPAQRKTLRTARALDGSALLPSMDAEASSSSLGKRDNSLAYSHAYPHSPAQGIKKLQKQLLGRSPRLARVAQPQFQPSPPQSPTPMRPKKSNTPSKADVGNAD